MHPSPLVRASILFALLAIVPHAGAQETTAFLTSRPRPETKAVVPIKVGDLITTAAGQRRRVVLANGVTVYLNQKSQFTYRAADEILLHDGEAFIDVCGRRPDPAKKSPLFTVNTPKSTCEGRDASWIVKDDGVAVIRGTVSVTSGKTRTAVAGTLLSPGGTATPLPRASHVLDWTRDLMTAAEVPLVPGSEYAGGALVAVDPNGQEAKLELRKFHVDVYIEDGFARTTIDQTYFNHEPSQLEGTFFFPLPPDASLSRLAMYVDGVLQEGGIVERDQAQRIYDEFRYANRDPALLEWVDGSTFKMRVFPIEGRQEKRLVLSYSQKLPVLNADTQYRFPAGHSLQTVRDWSFRAHVKNGASLNWASPSHALTARKLNGDLILDGSGKNVRTDRDVVVNLTETAPRTLGVPRVRACAMEDARYLMVRYQPELLGQAKAQRRDWVFLFEASGDRNPLLARAQIEVIRDLLQYAEADDTFAVLAANTRVRAWAKEPRPVTTENIAAAIAFLEATHLIGALDLGQALGEADKFLSLGTNPHLVHLGSGVPAMGERRADVLAKRIPDGTRYVGIGVGRRWARSFMKAAAERSGGLFTQINPDEPIGWRSFDLLATLNTPRLMDVHVVGQAALPVRSSPAKNGTPDTPENPNKLQPPGPSEPLGTGKAACPTFLTITTSMAQGEEICAIARLDKGQDAPESLTITGILDGKPWQKIVPVKDVAERADYLPRTWVKLEIDRLLLLDAVKHKNAIVALSKTMYVMTPFTSLLVLENEDMYTQYKVDRGRKDHWAMYACPEKIPVVYEPLDGEPDPKTVGKKMTVRQTLGTIVSMEVTPKKRDSWNFRAPVFERAMDEGDAPAIGMRRLPPELSDHKQIFQFSLGMFRGREGAANSVHGQFTPVLSAATEFAMPEELPRPNRLYRKGPAQTLQRFWMPEAFTGTNLSGNVITSGRNPSGVSNDQLVDFSGVAVGAVVGGLQSPFVGRAGGDGPEIVAGLVLRDRANIERGHHEGFQYDRPSFSLDNAFFDLVAYAPGMSTNMADVRAVVEAEAQPLPGSKLGEIDPAARALLQKSRDLGWQSWTPGDDKGTGQPAFPIHFDQRGSYQYERTLPFGVREKVICDGRTLLHLYPQLGIAAKREVSRFHRAEFADLVPWVVPSPEDLAHGADVKLIGERTIAVIPHAPKPRGRVTHLSLQEAIAIALENGTPNPAGKTAPDSIHIHMTFTPAGQLRERRAVLMPKNHTLYHLYFAPDGVVKLLDPKGKSLSIRQGQLTATADKAPNVNPESKDLKSLVVLALPYRTPEHVRKSLKIENKDVSNLRFQEALPLFAAAVAAGNKDDAGNIFRRVFQAHDQKQLGFYVLLASCGHNLDSQNLDVLAEHLDEPIAQYLALHTSPVLRKHASQWAVAGESWPDGFLKDLALTHALLQRWESDKVLKGDPAKVQAERRRAIDHVRRHKDNAFGWTLLGLMEYQTFAVTKQTEADKAFLVDLAASAELFKDNHDLSYAARYESARCLHLAGQKLESCKRFQELYADTLKQNLLPAIDEAFRQALEDKTDDPWSRLMTATAKQFIADKHRPAVLALARQCWRLDDQPLAQHLLTLALDGLTEDKERVPMILAEIELLREMGQVPDADAMLTRLLSEPQQAQRADLWRLAATLAGRRDMPARAIECLEKALDLEFRKLPDVIDLQAVRSDYGKLLAHYQSLADAMVALKIEPPPGFLTKVVKTADRWRSLDQDGEELCKATAQILDRLGDRDLSWDYLTTPIALSPGEASAWTNLAVSLSRRGDLKLADRAYQSAFEAEPANAQLLWDRAQNLRQAGDVQGAQRVLRQLAEGAWHVRFQGLQTQAKVQLREQR